MGTGAMMSEVISSALERKQPAVFLSGPSFAREVMLNRPTGVVAASKDVALARTVQVRRLVMDILNRCYIVSEIALPICLLTRCQRRQMDHNLCPRLAPDLSAHTLSETPNGS